MSPSRAQEAAKMKIDVNRVPEEGLRDQATYDPTTMDMDRSDIRLIEPFEVDVFVTAAVDVSRWGRCEAQVVG